jgi:hypothetical protein
MAFGEIGGLRWLRASFPSRFRYNCSMVGLMRRKSMESHREGQDYLHCSETLENQWSGEGTAIRVSESLVTGATCRQEFDASAREYRTHRTLITMMV